MTDSSLYYHYPNISAIVDDLSAAKQAMDINLQDLQSQIQPLQASWAGISDIEFTAVQNAWARHLAEMTVLLGSHSSVLATMADNTAFTDKGIAAQIASIP